MRLPLYSSTSRSETPNLAGLQDEAMHRIPTVLVCPLRTGLKLTHARLEIEHEKSTLIACPDLVRPIRRTALRFIGRLNEVHSREIMRLFLGLLAHSSPSPL